MKAITERRVSILPSEMAEEGIDFIGALSRYISNADREHKYGFRTRLYVKRGIEIAAALSSRPMEVTIACALDIGMGLLEQFEGPEAIRAARRSALHCGSDAIAFFERWTFELNSFHEGTVMLWSRVHPDITTRCNVFAHGLGLSTSTAASLAVMAALVHVPGLPDQKKRQMVAELVAFGRKLVARAEDSQHVSARARRDTSALEVTFTDVLRQIRE